MRRAPKSTGLEGAPDVMLLTMTGLMLALVWLIAHAHEETLPPINLPSVDGARLGSTSPMSITVTLRPVASGGLEVYVGDESVPSGLDGLESALSSAGGMELVLRADAETRWEHALRAMGIAARIGLPLAVAGEP